MDERAAGGRIIKRKRLFQMRSRLRKPAGKHQVSTGGLVTENEAGCIVSLPAQPQQTLVQALRLVEFAADLVMERLPKGNPKELGGRTQLLPQLSCAGIGMTGFRRRVTFESTQYSAQGAAKFELLSLTFGVVRQQRQLVQPFLQLRRRFRHRRASG